MRGCKLLWGCSLFEFAQVVMVRVSEVFCRQCPGACPSIVQAMTRDDLWEPGMCIYGVLGSGGTGGETPLELAGTARATQLLSLCME
jgi:hypothetical protein